MRSSPSFMEFEKQLNLITARDMMSRSVITAKKEMTLANLAGMLLEKKISGMPVVDDQGKLIGIITATDLFSMMFMLKTGQMTEKGTRGVINPTVDFAMSHEVLSANEDTTLNEIMNLMWGRNIHTLPVMDGEKIVGIIGRRDVLKYFYSAVGEIVRPLKAP